MFSRYRKKVTSWDRLKRVQEMERYQSAHDQGHEYGSDTRLLLIHDPIATLIYSDSRLWLAVGEVNGIKFAGKVIDRLGHNLLKEKAAKISFQLVGLYGPRNLLRATSLTHRLLWPRQLRWFKDSRRRISKLLVAQTHLTFKLPPSQGKHASWLK